MLSLHSISECIFLFKGTDCQWSSWSNTGQCSDQCRGVVIKSRTVLIPAKNGGSCVGNKYENEPCNENPFGPMGKYFSLYSILWIRMCTVYNATREQQQLLIFFNDFRCGF